MIWIAAAVAVMSYVVLDEDASLLGRTLALAAALMFAAVLGFLVAEAEVQTYDDGDTRGLQ